MDLLLVGFFILLFEGETTSETSKSQLSTRDNVPPVLQRLLLSDVSNIQLSIGRRSYFGSPIQMVGTSKSKLLNPRVDKEQTDTIWTTRGSSKRQYSVDGSPTPVEAIRKQFEDSFQQGKRNGIQFADVKSGNSESSPDERLPSSNSSQTPLGVPDSDTTGPASTEKTNITDGLWQTTTAIGVENSNLTENISTSHQTKNNIVTDPVQQITDKLWYNTTETASSKVTTDSVTQTTANVWTNITSSVTQTPTGNGTSSATISPTSDPCPEYPGLVAALVVTAMVLAVLVIMLLSLYCRRMVLICGSMCRCTKYTLV